MAVNEFLQNSADQFPNKDALIFRNERLSYQEIDKRTNQLAHALIEFGIEKGDRVAIYLPNSVEVVVAIFAVLKSGGAFLIINHDTKTEKLKYILNDSQAKALVCNSYINNILFSPKCKLPLKIVISGETLIDYQYAFEHISFIDVFDHYPSFMPEYQNNKIDRAALFYKAGSVGNTNSVTVSHDKIITAISSITQYLENTKDDIIINTLPLSLDFGLLQILATFKMGATLVLEHSFSYPLAIIDKILKEKVTGFPIEPKMITALLKLKNLENLGFNRLRYISYNGVQLAPKEIMMLMKIFPKTKIYCLYRQTNDNILFNSYSKQVEKHTNFVGKETTIEEIYLLNDEGEKIGVDEIDELVAGDSKQMKKYWELREESNRILKPGC